MNKLVKRNLRKYFNQCPSISSLEHAYYKGIAKKGWYARALRTIKYLYPKDYRLFIGILSATSPRQTVEKNLEMSTLIYNTWVSKYNRNKDLKTYQEDTWMITFCGLANSNLASSKWGYRAYSHRIATLAKRLKTKPANIQECVWSYTYASINKCNIKDVPEFDIQDILV